MSAALNCFACGTPLPASLPARCPRCCSPVIVRPAKARRRLHRWFIVPLLLVTGAFLLAIGLRNFDRYCSRGLPTAEGHRRPILFGLWHPGPRDPESIKARFLANIRKCGLNWGEPVWGGKGLAYCRILFGPHDYAVVCPYSWSGQQYRVAAVAINVHASRSIRVSVYAPSNGGPSGEIADGWSHSRGKFVLQGWRTKDDPERQVWQTAGAEIENALRDALE
jgi:hypothetical protein